MKTYYLTLTLDKTTLRFFAYAENAQEVRAVLEKGWKNWKLEKLTEGARVARVATSRSRTAKGKQEEVKAA